MNLRAGTLNIRKVLRPRSPGWLRDVRDSGVWVMLVIVVVFGVVLAVLDVGRWDRDFANGILAEGNAVLVELFIAGVLIATYDYHRVRSQERRDSTRELAHLRLSTSPDNVIRKVELLVSLAERRTVPTLDHYVLDGARLNGLELSGTSMRFCRLTQTMLVRVSLGSADLFAADFTGSTLVEADLAGANLAEATFSGARLSGASLVGADVSNADFRGAKELTCEQLQAAVNWQSAYRDPALACGAAIPDYGQRSLGQQFREQYRRIGNPTYPFVLGTLIEVDGSERTIVVEEEPRAD